MKTIKILSLFLLLTFTLQAQSEEGHDDHGDHDEHQEEKPLQLSAEAEKTLGIRLGELKPSSATHSFSVPKTAMVEFQDKHAVFVKRGKVYEFIPVQVTSEKEGQITLQSNKLKAGDAVVIQGVPLLRIAHLEATGQGGEGHAH